MVIGPPQFHVREINLLDARVIASRFRAVLLDIDNTLVPHGCETLTAETRKWLAELDRYGLIYALATNTSARRASELEESWGIEAFRALKPLPFRIRRWLKEKGLEPHEVLMVGDQVFTDHFAALAAGLASAIVTPISPHDSFFTALISRRLERVVFWKWREVQ